MKRARGLYDFYEAPPRTAAALELRDFGEEANSRLSSRGHTSERKEGQQAIQVAGEHLGPAEAMGTVIGGGLGNLLTSRLGPFGQGAGSTVGGMIGGALGGLLDGPVPESVARGVLLPSERDYPGYWGYSGYDGVGGWRRR